MRRARTFAGANSTDWAGKALAAAVLAATLLSHAVSLGAAGASVCEDHPPVKRLIEQATDEAAPYANRRSAFEEALRLCSDDPGSYAAYSVLLLKHGELPAALDWIHRGLKIAPENSGLRLSLGVALLSAGRASEALEVLDKLPADAKTEFYVGMANRHLGVHEAARRALLRAFELGYPDPYVLYVVIEQDLALGDKQAGLQHFQLLDQRFPNSPFLHLLLGDAHLSRNEDAEAEEEYRQALTENPALPVVHSKLGFLEFSRARYPEAVDLFRQEIALDPDFAGSYLYLGLCLRRLENNKEAIPAFEQAITRDSRSLNAYRQLAAALMQEGQVQQALDVLEKGAKLFPDDQPLQAQLARALTRLGRVTEAGQATERAHQLMAQDASASTGSPEVPNERLPRSSESLEREADSLTSHQKYAEALAAINHAIEADSRQPRYFISRGELYQKLGDQPSAIQSFLEAQNLGDRSPQTLYSIGMSFFALGYHDGLKEDYERAARHFRLAVQSESQFDRAEFMLGVIDAIGSLLPDAKRHFEKALLLSPENAYYHLHYGVVLNRLGDDRGALEQFQAANKLLASYAPTHFNLGKAYAHLGRYAEARTELETAVKINPNLSAAYYSLGGVYRHLGLEGMSREALKSFQKAKQQTIEDDPLEAAISEPESGAGGRTP
jgi:tetratricopeptide (TPR) repeat protein